MSNGKTIYPSQELEQKILDAAGRYGNFSAEACRRLDESFEPFDGSPEKADT